jgi:hypothetical protein
VVFFAAAPARLKAGDELVIEDALWREAKALGTIEAEGRDGFVLKAANAKDPAFPPARDGEARVFKARLMGVAGEKVTSRSGRDPCHGSNFEFRISNFPEWGISPKSTRDLVDYNRSPFARIDS